MCTFARACLSESCNVSVLYFRILFLSLSARCNEIYNYCQSWELAKKCWNKRPLNRPSFEEIIELLYPHLGDEKIQFDNMSYYQSRRSQYRNVTFSRSMNRLIPWPNFGNVIKKFTSTTCSTMENNNNNSQQQQQQKQSMNMNSKQRQQQLSHQNCCLPHQKSSTISSYGDKKQLNNCSNNNNNIFTENSNCRCSHRYSNGYRPRFPSFDSYDMQSGSACSQLTAITSISNFSSPEPRNIDVPRNSTINEQIPLI